MVAATILNCVLFLLLPIVIQPSLQGKAITDRIDSIQVIRLKKQETPPQKKEEPPEPPQEKPKPKEETVTKQPLKTPKLILPFKLNTRLPRLAADFQLPLAESIGIGHAMSTSVSMHDLDAPLTPTSRIPPVYPLRARRKGIEGWVRVGFEVEKDGSISNLHVLEATPPGYFEKSVINCVSRWRYKPGTVEGVPVKAKMETTVRFEME